MNAKEARDKAKEVNLNKSKGQYKEVLDKIAKAVDSGEYSCKIYSSLIKDVREQLEKDLYIVKESFGDQREGSVTTISW